MKALIQLLPRLIRKNHLINITTRQAIMYGFAGLGCVLIRFLGEFFLDFQRLRSLAAKIISAAPFVPITAISEVGYKIVHIRPDVFAVHHIIRATVRLPYDCQLSRNSRLREWHHVNFCTLDPKFARSPHILEHQQRNIKTIAEVAR